MLKLHNKIIIMVKYFLSTCYASSKCFILRTILRRMLFLLPFTREEIEARLCTLRMAQLI